MASDECGTADLLQSLYDWWTSPDDAGDTARFLGSDLTYDRGHGGLEGTDFAWWVEQKPEWRELRILDKVVQANKGALVFEGIDGGTDLRYRVSWFIEVRDGRVVRVVETNARIE